MKTTIATILTAILFLAFSCKKENNTIQSLSVTDKSSMDAITEITGKYTSVKIGTQKWMTKNLVVSHYRNGDKIPQVKSNADWAALTTGAWCWYNNDSATGAVYGKLYNWYAVNDPRGLAPTGWHIPTDAEWDTLSLRLGDDSLAGGKLKDTGTIEAGTGLWVAPNKGATNKSGFTALPSGYRDQYGNFANIGYFGYWWSSTQTNSFNLAYFRNLYHGDRYFYRYFQYKQIGYSVRCIKD